MSVQLNAPNAGNIGDFPNFFWTHIYENADGGTSRRQRVHNLADDPRLDVARARGIKVESNHVCAEFDAGAGITRICHPADLDLDSCLHQNCRASVSDATTADSFSVRAMKSRRAAPGSGVRISASPMRKPRNPSSRRWRKDFGVCNPLSEIMTRSRGASAI